MTARPSGKCIFCGEDGELTAEHPISARVLRLSGFELGDVFVPLDIPLTEMTTEWLVHNMRTVADEFVTCVCAPCNNGWMQNLDHSFAGTIERWTSNPSDRLGTVGLRVAQRYLLKVAWVRVLGEAWAGPLISETGELIPDVILNPSFGPLIRSGTIDDIVPVLSLGAAKISNESMFTSANFTPMIEGVPARSGKRRLSSLELLSRCRRSNSGCGPCGRSPKSFEHRGHEPCNLWPHAPDSLNSRSPEVSPISTAWCFDQNEVLAVAGPILSPARQGIGPHRADRSNYRGEVA